MSNATTTVPSNPPGCWANSLSALTACCTRFGGVQLSLPDSAIPACAYNNGTGFTPDDGSGSADSTSARWAGCVSTYFNSTASGESIITTCVDSQDQIATVTSKVPASTATSGGVSTTRSGAAPVLLGGMLFASVVLHVISLAV
ncbi:hypothetical protein FB45DRAFT_1006593 [Roridomyces roridus]|uniref:Uncharacterized protein n=1 Tax=Roridomyces roridus TaxID=1738132 RepID=A0AAD7FFK4_9AGAR|nr:hypothetical protein FB45DRAFT_1006593 [Roridomyces roridus]